MPDWSTRLQLDYIDPDSKKPVTITPIDSFSPTFGMAGEVLHSIEQTHIGFVFSPQTVSFTMSVKAIGPVAGQLTSIAMSRTPFTITLHENTGSDWAFVRIVLSNCLITSAQPTSATISGAPSATFSGVSLGALGDPKLGATTSIP